MKLVFADTFYWSDILYPGDDWHRQAVALTENLAGKTRLTTTEEVLSELLTFFASSGIHMRRQAVGFVRNIIENSETLIVPQTHQSFQAGIQLYEQRLDKGYSLIDLYFNADNETDRNNRSTDARSSLHARRVLDSVSVILAIVFKLAVIELDHAIAKLKIMIIMTNHPHRFTSMLQFW